MNNRTYKVSDLFYTNWQQVSAQRLAEGYTAYSILQGCELGSDEYGKALIMTLRALRKNPRLVDQITVEQAVDIFNEIAPELSKPWYSFPQQRIAFRFQFLFAPKEKMGNRTFDHLVYADSCLMKILNSAEPEKQLSELSRLASILYTRSGEHYYNDREVTAKQVHWQKNLELWQLQAIFYTFAHIKKYIVEGCQHLFEQPKGDAGTGPVKVSDSMPMWSEIKFALAESGVFGTFDEVGRTDLYKVINYLESRAKKQKEAASNAKSK